MQIKDDTEAGVLYSFGHKTPSLSQVSNIDIQIFLLAFFFAGFFPEIIQIANLTDSNTVLSGFFWPG